VLGATACSRGRSDDAAETTVTTAGATTTTTDASTRTNPPIITINGSAELDGPATTVLGVTLSEGAPVEATPAGLTVVEGEPLSDEQYEGVLTRLPAWDIPTEDNNDLQFPTATLTPPQTGDTIDTPFPPPPNSGSPEIPAGTPLRVVRFQPEGAVDLAAFVSVTFDQPMVPLATLDGLEAVDPPVTLDPPVAGRWRWIGTRTLRFEVVPGTTDRLPAATAYTATVPAGTESVNGGVLGEAVSWQFTTPTPTVTSFVGADRSLTTTPVFVAIFDQLVNPEAVLDTITLAAGGQAAELRVATDDEVAADDAAAAAIAAALDGRWVAFTPLAPLPVDTTLSIDIGPNTPSLEGPLTSETVDSYEARTFGALRVLRHACDTDTTCTPGAPFGIEFNNELDPELFDASQVTITPAVPGLRIDVYGSFLQLYGATSGRTIYTVTLDADLHDVFGQTLGSDIELTFDVGPATPSLRGLERQWITTDPADETPSVSVLTVNHDAVHLTVWAVSPDDLDEYHDYQMNRYSDVAPPEPDWPVLIDTQVSIDAATDRAVETAIDLTDAFEQIGGQAGDQAGSQVVVRVSPTEEYDTRDELYWQNQPTVSWVQRTTLGVDAFVDQESLVIWTTDLRTGEPVGGVPVELLGDGRVATTNDEGVAAIEFGNAPIRGLFANAGDRAALLAADWHEGWTGTARTDEARWYTFDDRGIYRPGETVRLAGWLRNIALSSDGSLELYEPGTEVTYRSMDAQGTEIAAGTAQMNALGGFNVSFEIPEGANLGSSWVEFSIEGLPLGPSSHSFQIQEFRRPEFEVTARNDTPGPYFAADPATIAVDATYYAGGPLPGANVEWIVGTTTTNYSPPNWDDYSFGIWTPWWFDYGYMVDSFAVESTFDGPSCFEGCDTTFEQFTGITDAGGSHYLNLAFDGNEVDLPSTVDANATVYDVNRQAWSSSTSLLVHPAEYYVGLSSDRPFVEQGTPIRIDAVVTDVDGVLVAGRDVDVTAGRLESKMVDGVWTEEVVDPETCEVTSVDDVEAAAREATMRCEFATEVGGQYRITAVVTDDGGHRNRTELSVWVSGGTSRPSRTVARDSLTIVPDREHYAVGDTAQLLVQAPFAPATGLVTVMHNGVVSTHTFTAQDGSAIVEIPIDESSVPNLNVQVEVVGSTPRVADDGTPAADAPPRPAYAGGTITLNVPPITRTLSVTATPAAEALQPGASTSVTVDVLDAEGNPVADANVAVVVVDEAVLALTAYELADPLDVFYQPVYDYLQAQYARAGIQLTRADLMNLTSGGDDDAASETTTAQFDGEAAPTADSAEYAEEESGAGGANRAGADGAPIDVRSNFEALAVFAPDGTTNANGSITVEFDIPDNLTRYRVMAVAVAGAEQFGKGESTITARLPLMVRPSAPRFLNFGDEFELPVVVQNQTDSDLVVDVVVEVDNLTLTGDIGKHITVPANDRVEVRFPATTVNVGTARFRTVAVSADYADAAEGALPVYTPATAEAFATYGVLDGPAVAIQPAAAPTGVFPQFGGLEINTSATALQSLTDAVIYLNDYPYQSADGYASRIMAIASLRDVLDAFEADGLPSSDELTTSMSTDTAGLAALQNDDGGFPYWQRGRPSVPMVSIQAVHALVLARDAGYPANQLAIDRGLDYLANIEQYIPTQYDDMSRNTLRAYAIHVRGVAGDVDTAKATSLYTDERHVLQPDAVAWLWPSITDTALRAEIATSLLNRAVDTAGTVTFATDYTEDAYVIAHSNRRTDGIVLDALITQVPESELIPKTVAGLMAGQSNAGHWNNVLENAFILVALNRYFQAFESVSPDFIARVWLGELYVSEHPFAGFTTDRASTLLPMSDLIANTTAAGGTANITVQNDGVGRLYFRLGLRYAPDDLVLAARDEGFVVERMYEGVDDPADVTRDADGTWRIRAGAKVRVTLTMVADAQRTHVALVDPLPAGLEPLNPVLATTQTIPPEEGGESGDDPYWRSWSWSWFDHQNMRDDRVEAFATFLPGGTYEYSYVARATTPGTFVVPPARAEEIYAPETFGRSASTTVAVG
jgi:uncharacterized protein YfaS (alpha-2-macroglobulin family)